MKTQLDAVSGTPVPIPPCAAWRLVADSGLASYPRTVRFGSSALRIYGPNHWQSGSPDGGILNVSPSDADKNFLTWANTGSIVLINAQDPKVEGWVVECVECLDEANVDPVGAALRLLYITQARAWDNATHGRYSQAFDVRGFTDVYIDAWSTGADGFTLNVFSMCPDDPIGPNGAATFGPAGGNQMKRMYLVDNATQGHVTAAENTMSFGGGLVVVQTTGDFTANGDINFAIYGRPR